MWSRKTHELLYQSHDEMLAVSWSEKNGGSYRKAAGVGAKVAEQPKIYPPTASSFWYWPR